MSNTTEKDNVIDGLVNRLVSYSHGIHQGDMVAHKTDLDLENIYVVTKISMNLEDEEIYLQCSTNAKGVHHDGATFKLIEMMPVRAPEPVEE